jgi:hypothetical protein
MPNRPTTVEALEASKALLGCWSKGEAHDPTRFGAAIAAVLQCYSYEVVQFVCDPRCGLPFTQKWPPTGPQEVRAACELRADIIFAREEVARRADNERLIDQGLSPRLPPPPKPTTQDLEERYGKGWGLGGVVPINEMPHEQARALPAGSVWTAETLVAHYQKHGLSFVPKKVERPSTGAIGGPEGGVEF